MPKSCISFNEVVNKTHQFDKNLESRILKSMPKKFTKPKFQRVRIQRWVSFLRIGLVVIHILLGSLFYLLLATFNSKVKKLGYLSS